MTKKIFEELPARKFAPAAAPAAKGKESPAPTKSGSERGNSGAAPGDNSEKKIRQAVYDIRYRARREGLDIRAAFAQYMQNSNLSAPEQAEIRGKLFGKDGGGDSSAPAAAKDKRSEKNEQYIVNTEDWATDTVANALFKVFVEKVEKQNFSYEEKLDEETERKYKIRVTDPKTDRSYVRYGTREKITQLRAKGLKVEMTEYGEPYEGERKRGSQTATALGGGGERKAKRDYDGDGKVESGSKEHAGAVHNAIQRNIGGTPDGKDTRKEEYLIDGTTSTEGQNRSKITGTGVDNYSNKVVTVMPENGADLSSTKVHNGPKQGLNAHNELTGELIAEKAKSKAQQRFMGMVYATKKGKKAPSPEVEDAAQGISKKDAKKFAKTKHKGLKEGHDEKMTLCEPDTRDKKTYRELLKNKLRAMGIRNPLIMDVPDGEDVMKIMTSSSAKMAMEKYVLQTDKDRVIMPGDPPASKASPSSLVKPIGTTVKRQYENPYRPIPGSSD